MSVAAVLLMAKFAFGVSIAPQIVEQLKESGQLQSIVEANISARDRGVWQPNSMPYRFGLTADVDTLHCLIILVDFDDMPHENGFDAEPSDFDTLLFSRGVRNPGSMADFYNENSYGKAFLTGQISRWYRMPELYSYYVDGQRGFGSYPNNAQRLTEDAIVAADPDIDFSLYDNNGDGMVDALFVVHAGPGYEDTGNLNYIHSHAWVMSRIFNFDGVQLWGYSMEPEETGSGQLSTIGVYCHEFGHVLGVPDLYDYGYDSQGVGGWSVMAGGSWGGGGAVPVHFDGWSKYKLGWAIPTELSNNVTHEQIDAVEYSPDTYILYGYGIPDPQYFLVENRRRELFDISVPGDGLLIYHIDEAAPNNDDQTHYKVAVEQADGLFDLENNRDANRGDPWPGSTNNRLFDDTSTPNAHFYDGGASEISVMNISDSDSIMYADLGIMYSAPYYQLLSFTVNDSAGNGNGRPEPGETCQIIFSAQNIRMGANDLVVTVSCNDDQVIFSDSVSSFGVLPVNTPFDNRSDPMTFSLPMDYGSNFAVFTLRFSAMNNQYHQEFTRRWILGIPNFLLVDDDNGDSVDTYYTAAMESLGQAYDKWDVSTQGSPCSALADYDYIIWFTGDTRPDETPAQDIDSLISYLAGGGHIMITSQDFVQHLFERNSPQDSILAHEYLKVGYFMRENEHREDGVARTVFDSLNFYSAGIGGGNNQLSQDALTVYPGGTVMMSYRDGHTAAVASVENYKSLTLGFGAEGINDTYPTIYDRRIEFFRAALRFLLEPVGIEDHPALMPERLLMSQNYPNPFNPATMIAFETPSAGPVELAIFDIMGRLIERPVDERMAAGKHVIQWDGGGYASGIYFYRLTFGGHSETRRMTLAK